MSATPSPGDIARVATRLGRQVEIALAAAELSTAQYRVLYQLSEGDAASSSLATQIAVSPPSITNVVEGLVQRGLVRREPSADDRRRVPLRLTESGEAALAAADQVIFDRLSSLVDEVDDPGFAEVAFGGLAQWKVVFKAHRAVRLAEKARKARIADK